MGAVVMQADVQGRTITGQKQAAAGIAPRGAQVTFGVNNAGDKKLNQQVVFSSTGTPLPSDFTFGSPLPTRLAQTLVIDPTLLGKDKVAELNVFTNQAAVVRDALRAPQGGGVSVTAEGIAINANVSSQSGRLNFTAQSNSVDHTDRLLAVVEGGVPVEGWVRVKDGMTLSARGEWANNLPTVPNQPNAAALVNGGSVTLTGPAVALGQNSVLDVSGGGSIGPYGAVKSGDGGNVSLAGSLQLHGSSSIVGYALGKGGTLSIADAKVQVGGPKDPTALNLDAGFFESGGFANFDVTGTTSVNIADGTVLRPTVKSRELTQGYNLQTTGSNIDAFTRIAKRDDRVRQSANVSFKATGKEVGEGVVRLGEGAQISADAQAKVAFEAGNRVELLGQVRSMGGTVAAKVAREGVPFNRAAVVYLGERAVLDVSGGAQTYTDNRGLTQGKVLAGGNVDLNGQGGAYVVTKTGSRIDLRGAGTTTLDVRNEAGSLGRTVASDAGTLKVTSSEGAMLDGLIQAQPTSARARGGTFEISLPGDNFRTADNLYPQNERGLTLSNNAAPQAAGVTPGDAIDLAANGNSELNVQALEAAGFDRMKFHSKDAIRVASSVALGASRALPMRALEFSAGRVESAGGNAAVNANYVRFSNNDNVTAPAPVAGTGTFTANAQLLEVAGNVTLTGMQTTALTGAEEVRLSGRGSDLNGSINTASNLDMSGGVIAPATAAKFTVNALGSKVEFKRTSTAVPDMPYSAFGSLTVKASDIVQDGNVWAPLGELDLQAEDTLVFTERSRTSVATTGALLPYGRIENGRKWVYGADGSKVDVASLPTKAIRIEGASVDQQPGARLDISGGGDFQAYEFTAGPGGSRDILVDANTYAILPSYKGKFAPTDAQEGFDRVAGEQVFLSGVPNLADGYYTLLPAHYALLPGAYAVRLETGVKDLMPGQAYTRQDGVRVAPGYLTDSRTNAPRDANWQGIQVLTGAQVRERSQFALVRGSDFFADGSNRPQDAGVLSVTTTGVGADKLKLDGIVNLAAGTGGRRGAVDISAQNLVITGANTTGVDPNATQIGVARLNALGAGSLLLGGTRTVGADATTLDVGAQTVTLANGGAAALQAGEVILAAEGTLILGANSSIDAQGAAGDAGTYNVVGNGALVRAASTTAALVRTGTTANTAQGVLVGNASSTVRASDSVRADATGTNSFASIVEFGSTNSDGTLLPNPQGGNLAVGASGINFLGANATVPTGAGISYTQTQLNALAGQRSLEFTSYSSFDMVGDVTVAATQNLTLQGAGLKGVANDRQTASLRAQNITLTNPNLSTPSAATPGSGTGSTLNIVAANTLTLGDGAKRIEGFRTVRATANELVTAGKPVSTQIPAAGSQAARTEVTAPSTTIAAATTTLTVARLRGERGADQTLTADGTLNVTRGGPSAVHPLDTAVALGSSWTLKGTSVSFDAQAVLPSGSFKLEATGSGVDRDVTLGANANIDVAGRTVRFFDVSQPTWGGTAAFTSANGSVTFAPATPATPDTPAAPGARVDVSGAPGADGGLLKISAANGTISLPTGSVQGTATAGADGARAQIDVQTLASYSDLNTALNNGGFAGERDLRVRSGNVEVALRDETRAQNIRITADGVDIPDDGVDGGGAITVNGTLDASGSQAGRVALFGNGNVTIGDTANLRAVSSAARKDGGTVEIGTQGSGAINMVAGSRVDVSGGAAGPGGTVGRGGKVQLRAERNNDTVTHVNVTAVNSTITGARSVELEAVEVYRDKNFLTTAASGTSTGTNSLSLNDVMDSNTAFAVNHNDIKDRLGKTGDTSFQVLSGVEVRSTGDITLANDWNMSGARAGAVAEAPGVPAVAGVSGVLTLRANGRINIDNNLSDGFTLATSVCAPGTCTYNVRQTEQQLADGSTPVEFVEPAKLTSDRSWSYRLVSGADLAGSDSMAVKAGANRSADFTLAANKLIRTGTGDIRIASGGNITLANSKSAIYTAGNLATVTGGFIVPTTTVQTKAAQAVAVEIPQFEFSSEGGNVSLSALEDVVGSRSTQLYSDWLYRQGKLDPAGTGYQTQPAWWVRFDKFAQGVATLGGGDVTIRAGGKVQDVSASAATQAHTETPANVVAGPTTSVLKKTGGGSVRVETGADLLGGQYYADGGKLVLKVGGKLADGSANGAGKLYTVLALGDAQARVQTRDSANIHAIINPHMVAQSYGANGNIALTTDSKFSVFSSYSDQSAVSLSSLADDVNFFNFTSSSAATGTFNTSAGPQTLASLYAAGPRSLYGAPPVFSGSGPTRREITPGQLFASSNSAAAAFFYDKRIAFGLLPSSVALTSFQSNVLLDGGGANSNMRPAPTGNLAVLAAGSVNMPGILKMSDTLPVPDAMRPASATDEFTALKPSATDVLHEGDNEPVRIYAVNGDVTGKINTKSLTLPKPFRVKAGKDVRDLTVVAQHSASTDVSSIDAGQDFVYSVLPSNGRSENGRIWISGPGRLEVTAGRDIDLGASAGLVSRGNVDNRALPAQGASIQVAAGVGPAGIDYGAAIDRLLAKLDAPAADDTSLWHARWLTGNNGLSRANAAQAVRSLRVGTPEEQRTRVRERVRDMFFTALKQSGVDHNTENSPYAGDYSRGYAAIELLFPSQNIDGSTKNYKGDINLFASRISTEFGGNIEFMAPGGKMIVGLPNTATRLLDYTKANGVATGLTDSGALGIVASAAPGDVKGFAHSDVLVNQARILAVGGGDVLLWSSEGDIDAGKGKKTASVVPPPLDITDANGNVTRVLQGAAEGSGIGALPTPGAKPGDAYLIAPKGTVNAGDAGIRAGSLLIAAQVVLGAENIRVSGASSGVPVADTSAISATASGATSAGNDFAKTLADLNQTSGDSAKNAQAMKDAFKPTFVRVELVGFGE
jgi:hypothetical protein